jgi:hypothetical protein
MSVCSEWQVTHPVHRRVGSLDVRGAGPTLLDTSDRQMKVGLQGRCVGG